MLTLSRLTAFSGNQHLARNPPVHPGSWHLEGASEELINLALIQARLTEDCVTSTYGDEPGTATMTQKAAARQCFQKVAMLRDLLDHTRTPEDLETVKSVQSELVSLINQADPRTKPFRKTRRRADFAPDNSARLVSGDASAVIADFEESLDSGYLTLADKCAFYVSVIKGSGAIRHLFRGTGAAKLEKLLTANPGPGSALIKRSVFRDMLSQGPKLELVGLLNRFLAACLFEGHTFDGRLPVRLFDSYISRSLTQPEARRMDILNHSHLSRNRLNIQ